MSGCSEAFTVFVVNACSQPIEVVVSENDGPPFAPTEVAAGATVDVWGYCCEPGGSGNLTVTAGAWTTTASFDQLRDMPTLTAPLAACEPAPTS